MSESGPAVAGKFEPQAMRDAPNALMQAPKNGFFYVLDRATGELISAEPYVEITWAKGVDKKTGRPIENPSARYKTEFSAQKPGPLGGHNWMPMSFNPQTGLVYIPAQDTTGLYVPDAKFKYRPGAWNTGVRTKAASSAQNTRGRRAPHSPE